MTTPASVVIVGASLAGQRAAESLRERGFEGRVLLVDAANALPCDRPPLSKSYLAGHLEVSALQLMSAAQLAALNIELRLGARATRLDAQSKTVILEDGTALGYGSLIIATGCSAWAPEEWLALGGVHILRTLDDAAALRADLVGAERVAVIGAGFIGSEVASTITDLGIPVTLVDPLAAPLQASLGEAPGAAVARLHSARGVDVRCGVSVLGLEGDGRVQAVRLSDGSVVEADVVVVGIGVRTNDAWLQGSGVVLDNGVQCDAYLRTSVDDVYAIGDVARWLHPLYGERIRREHWTTACEQGAFVAGVIVGDDVGAGYDAIPFVWSDQLGLKIEMVGARTAGDELRIVEGDVVGDSFVGEYVRNGRVVGALAFNAPRKLLPYRRSLPATLAAS